jgi:hypothetical protein
MAAQQMNTRKWQRQWHERAVGKPLCSWQHLDPVCDRDADQSDCFQVDFDSNSLRHKVEQYEGPDYFRSSHPREGSGRPHEEGIGSPQLGTLSSPTSILPRHDRELQISNLPQQLLQALLATVQYPDWCYFTFNSTTR